MGPETFYSNEISKLYNAVVNLKTHNIAIKTINESFKIANDKLEVDYNTRILQDFYTRLYIDLDATGSWTFLVNVQVLYSGTDFEFDCLQVQQTMVSAPTAITI
jgi:hypothetical protein